MPNSATPVGIPARALFKAAEVCALLKVQAYVLRSWEAEFPGLGVTRTAGGPRTYRRKDVEQVARIKHLLLVEGLTLAGARRKLDEDGAPITVDAPAIEKLIGKNARERLTTVKRGLRSILELIGSTGVGQRTSSPARAVPRARATLAARTKTSPGKASARKVAARSNHSRRKRTAQT